MTGSARPNFFIIGAAKAATTSLSSMLNKHPQASIVKGKEPHFFSIDDEYLRGWPRYLRLFDHCNGERAIGDASTSYSRLRSCPLTVERIYNDVPDAKIIYMVRHPLKRMESAYVQHLSVASSLICGSINDAVRQRSMIIESSRYWEVFDGYRQKFDESRIKIVWFEEFAANSTSVFQDVCRFLEIDDSVESEPEETHQNSRADALKRMANLGRASTPINTGWDPRMRQWVINQIREDNCHFLDYFGRPRNYWGELF